MDNTKIEKCRYELFHEELWGATYEEIMENSNGGNTRGVSNGMYTSNEWTKIDCPKRATNHKQKKPSPKTG